MNIELQNKIANADTATLVDINDWAVNTVRDFARAKGYDALALVAGERFRPGLLDGDLLTYLRASRRGSKFLISREVRKAVFAIYATRARLG